jgi:hypothetical protein
MAEALAVLASSPADYERLGVVGLRLRGTGSSTRRSPIRRAQPGISREATGMAQSGCVSAALPMAAPSVPADLSAGDGECRGSWSRAK